MNTFYLWDFADTLFPERWDEARSGFKNYDDYLRSLGKDPGGISPREYEEAYEAPMRTGFLDVSLNDGFSEVLTWTKNNAGFTTGNSEQLDWRAEQLQRKYGFDVRQFLPEVFSTFDYANTNKKTAAMFADILRKAIERGYNTVVYTDNDLKNCEMAIEAGMTQVYHMRNDGKGLRKKGGYWEIGSLRDLASHSMELDTRRNSI